ncbi:MAG TPA: hypothetical protein VHD39_01690, partial [Acidimicrobiales bacterium]|nr:hypothetical protein [Acidimicrobiales bacterium]
MPSEPAWLARLARVAGPLDAVRPLGGAYLVEAGGTTLVAKPGPGARDEADGLRRIGAVAAAPPVPQVVLADDDLLVTAAVAQAPRTSGHDEGLGWALGALHRARLPRWGGGSSYIGRCEVDPAEADDAPAFYGRRLTALARRCALEAMVAPVVARLADLIPP